MSFPQGVNFRSTSGFVTDPTNYTYEISTTNNYPVVSAQGNNIGWESGANGNTRDRNSGVDPRIAGVTFGIVTGGTYRIDMPTSGSKNVRIAAGDYGSYGSACAWDLYDTTTNLHSLTTGSTSAAKRWKDAQNVEYTDATWPGSNSVYNATFATTIFRIKSTNSASISSVYVENAGGGTNTYILNPGGSVTFSGAAALLRTRTQLPSGSVTFSGSSRLNRVRTQVPAGSVTFSGTSSLTRIRAQVPSGLVTFSGSAPMTFTPAGGGGGPTPMRTLLGVGT